MNTPLVSVIIPCYNQAHFLNDAVNSALESGYENIEIIVINDGSTKPEQIEMLNAFSAPKTRIIHQQNAGLPTARNNAIATANGKYILPLDADDMVAKGFISKAVEVSESDPNICIVSGGVEIFGLNGVSRMVPSKYDGLKTQLQENNFHACSLFRRSDWEISGGYSPLMVYGMEDWDFWTTLLELSQDKRAVKIPELSLHYRIHENSMLRDLIESKQKKTAMLNMIIRRHLDSFLANPDSLANFVIYNYNPHESLDLSPKAALGYFDKYMKYRKLFVRVMWLSVALLTAVVALIIALLVG